MFLLLNAKPELQWQILNKSISQNKAYSQNFSVIFRSKILDFPYVSIVNEVPVLEWLKTRWLLF
jgi:hypothetical protein